MAQRAPGIALCLGPVQPRQGVVLAVRIVVAVLAVAELVAGQQHWRAVGQEQCCQHSRRARRCRLRHWPRCGCRRSSPGLAW
ncbi:hypothetical protein G6F35_018460 [Rhizopus arrhizus]|nr:hypothetical protein G6F35_018460 [Rhizopus arrhizus]